MPNPIAQIRRAVHVVVFVTQSGKKILRLIVPIIAVVSEVAQEIRRKK
ncbi:MAG: hypothetical protein WCQ57_14790 [Verrucomicrobiota bacterium]